jgi:hypothetical protein
MNRQLLPPAATVAVAVVLALVYGRSLYDRGQKQSAINAVAQRDLAATTRANQALAARIAGAATELSQARDFLARWEAAQAGATRGGLENRFIEPANQYDVLAPTPRFEQNPSVFLQSDTGKIESRNLHFSAEGRVTSLARFYAEAERSLPTGIVRMLQLRAGERAPELNVDVSVLQHAFVDMPALPAGTAAGDASGLPVLAKRPDLHKTAVPNLSENLIARAVQKAGPAPAAATDLAQFVGDLKVTGLVWNVDAHKRALLISGYILRQGQYLPLALVKAKGRVLLTEIGRDFAIFTVETEELNQLTGKKEKSYLTREFHFTLFNGLSSEG